MNWDFDNSYLSLPATFYNVVTPDELDSPAIAVFNRSLALELGLEDLIKDDEEIISVLSGNRVPKNAASIAQAYGGHQFGHFNILGDGRAWLLGEIVTPYEDRYDIQLKGSGVTPYSRRGDGRATLYSMLREYLISEAMHSLGVSTTRSLAVISGENPIRRQKIHEAGVLSRVAQSHIRVGTFELAVRMGKKEHLKSLFEYTVRRHYPEVLHAERPALAFLKAVIDEQIRLVNDWLRFGFIHGVMNTDNMSIAGETIDYGPCAFMNYFDPNTVFSSIDEGGRYAYSNQPEMAKWNLMRLAETLLHLIDNDSDKAIDLAQKEFDVFEEKFNEVWKINHLAKIGIVLEQDGDEELLNELMAWMEEKRPDFTNTFRGLVDVHLHDAKFFQDEVFQRWKLKWKKRISAVDRYEDLLRVYNPAVIPRNHLVEEALLAASEAGDYSYFNNLLAVLKMPFDSPGDMKYQTPPDSEVHYKTFCGT